MLTINPRIVLSVAGTVLGVASTVVTGIANTKTMNEQIEKKVAEEVAKHLSK